MRRNSTAFSDLIADHATHNGTADCANGAATAKDRSTDGTHTGTDGDVLFLL